MLCTVPALPVRRVARPCCARCPNDVAHRGTVVSVSSIDFDALRPQLAELCLRYGIAELSVFGSIARGDDRPDSDVDFLYVTASDTGMDFGDLLAMEDELVQLLHRPVDLVPKLHLHRVIRPRVLAEAQVLYAA